MSKRKNLKITYHEAINRINRGSIFIEQLPFRIVQEIQFNIENNRYKQRELNKLSSAGFETGKNTY